MKDHKSGQDNQVNAKGQNSHFSPYWVPRQDQEQLRTETFPKKNSPWDEERTMQYWP